MTTEEALVEKWRSLTPDKKQQVLNLVETLYAETVVPDGVTARLKAKPVGDCNLLW